MINVNAIFSHHNKGLWDPYYNVVLENLQEERERMKHLDSFFLLIVNSYFFSLTVDTQFIGVYQ
jgi:hypothetical protein